MSVETIALDETQSLMIVSDNLDLKKLIYYKLGIIKQLKSIIMISIIRRHIQVEKYVTH